MCDISIHAPTRGATENCKCSECPLTISIHAPTRGATVGLPQNMTDLILFQSTLLQEERPRVSQQQFASWDYFNPRSYKRSDFVFAHFFFLPKFQSTLLQEERLACEIPSARLGLFQSTLLQEERLRAIDDAADACNISIHAPTRGATAQNVEQSWYIKLFQSTLLQEERPVGMPHLGCGWLFQSTLLL